MKKIALIAGVLLLVGALAVPALAQEDGSPIDEVEGVQVERPLPRVEDKVDERAGDVTVVAGRQLARTGIGLTTGTLLAVVLLAGGGVLVLLARRREPTKS